MSYYCPYDSHPIANRFIDADARGSVKINYEERDGRTYAYVSTSRRVPGRKTPVSTKIHLGVVDPVSGEIDCRRIRESTSIRSLDGASVKSYGDVLVAMKAAERIGIKDDLEVVFGDDADRILAVAISLATHPTPFDSLMSVIETSCIREMLCVHDLGSLRDIRCLVNSIRKADVLRFFNRRGFRSSDTLYAYAHRFSSEHSQGSVRGLSCFPESNRIAVVVVTDGSGKMLGFEMVRDPSDDTSDIRKIMGLIRDVSRDCIFVADTAMSNNVDISDLIRGRVDFAIPYVGSSEAYRSVSSDYDDVSDPVYEQSIDGVRFYLKPGMTGVFQSNRGSVFVPESDPRFNDCSIVLRSFMCYDPRMRSCTLDLLSHTINEMKQRLNGMPSTDSEADLLSVAGPLARFLRCTVDSDGRLKVTVRRKEMARFHNDAGKTFVITSSATWDDVIKARAARTNVSSVIDQFFAGSSNILRYASRGISIEPYSFIVFLSILVYQEIQSTLDANCMTMTVDDVFRETSTYKLIVSDGVIFRSSRSRRACRILKVFEIGETKVDLSGWDWVN